MKHGIGGKVTSFLESVIGRPGSEPNISSWRFNKSFFYISLPRFKFANQ